jgi:hypothetical protein
MYRNTLQSDQFYTWSDEYTEAATGGLAQTTYCSSAPVTSPPGDPARLTYRALQALRQAGMQMRRWPRSRPQILSLREPPRLTATNGLCAAGVLRTNGRAPGQLSPGSRDIRRDLRDQPRTAAPPRGTLRNGRERSAFLAYGLYRCEIGWRAPRQYARRLVGSPSELFGGGISR